MSTHSPIGLFGGTFDPPHKGHLSLALSVFKALELKEIYFIPCAQPPLRGLPIASADDRIAMLKTMIKPYPYLKANDIEIKRDGKSYTIDTVTAIRKTIGKNIPLCFIMSIDQFMQFDRWRKWEHILDVVHLVITNRANHKAILNETLRNLVVKRQIVDKNLLHQTPYGSIIFEEAPLVPISSTEIRANLRKNSDFLPPQVWKYICENKLYSF